MVLLAVLSGCGTAARENTGPVVDDVLRIVSDTKTEPEFRSVFGHEPSEGELHNAAQSVGDLVRNGKNTIVLGPSTKGAETLASRTLSLIRNSSGKAVTLVGHNEAGSLRFGDSSVLSIEDAAQAAPPGSLLLILSCSAQQYINVSGRVVGPTVQIAYDDAAAIERAFYSSLPAALGNLTKADLDGAMSNALATVARQTRLTVVGVSTGVAVASGSGAYAYVETTR
jgi:hypothetical protein